MFFDWVTKGAEIGTVAFVALVIFALYLAAMYGAFSLLTVVASVFGGRGEDDMDRD